ncbi:2-phytyl-1,4-beta-naphthoquinone methyltransferase, chloroplastic [Hordeum vulgare]|nr:2-phytyl-1,4-beta-naphthoquinone methyltransferase, chloroplastic [Hordeum vulgare]
MYGPERTIETSATVQKKSDDDTGAVQNSWLNDVLSLGQHRTWKGICVSWSKAKRGDRVLDLCCGSGDLAFLLSQKVDLDGEVMGVDFSGQQLQTAASRHDQRWKACYKNIKWIEGGALDLPFTDRYFDAVTFGYGLHNVVDKPKAMREILSS